MTRDITLDSALLISNLLPTFLLTVLRKNGIDSVSSFISELLSDVRPLSDTSVLVNRRLKELKSLLKGDPVKPKDEELDTSFEWKLASLVQRKDLVSSLKPNEKRRWNDVLAGMVSLSKRSHGRVATQEVVNQDQEATTQDSKCWSGSIF